MPATQCIRLYIVAIIVLFFSFRVEALRREECVSPVQFTTPWYSSTISGLDSLRQCQNMGEYWYEINTDTFPGDGCCVTSRPGYYSDGFQELRCPPGTTSNQPGSGRILGSGQSLLTNSLENVFGNIITSCTFTPSTPSVQQCSLTSLSLQKGSDGTVCKAGPISIMNYAGVLQGATGSFISSIQLFPLPRGLPDIIVPFGSKIIIPGFGIGTLNFPATLSNSRSTTTTLVFDSTPPTPPASNFGVVLVNINFKTSDCNCSPVQISKGAKGPEVKKPKMDSLLSYKGDSHLNIRTRLL